jgi:hypothetical protein
VGHNFVVEWHFKFEVEIGEKRWSTPANTVYRHQENLQVGVQFMQNP